MDIGDLVRVKATPEEKSKTIPVVHELALVADLTAAFPADPYETDQAVTIIFADGHGEIWYDWQLELISESR